MRPQVNEVQERITIPSNLTTARKRERSDWLRFAGIGPVLLLLVVSFSIASPVFLTLDNLSNVLREGSVLFVMAIGMTFVLLTGGYDLSVGSMLALSGILLSALLKAGLPPVVAVLLTLVVAGLLGNMVNGFLIGRIGLSFFVVTLGTMSLFRGIVYVYTNGRTEYTDRYPLIQTIGDGYIGFMSVPILITVIVCLIAYATLEHTKYGRTVYAVGGNPEAAALAGINVARIRISVYAISALAAGLGGIITVGRLSAASPVVGTGMELSVGAAVLLGGTSFSGGEGSVVGTFIGTLFVVVLQNGLSLMGISSFWQSVITGAVLIAAVYVDRIRSQRDSA